MSPDQIVAKIARGKGSGTVPTVDEATRINYDACERISETGSMHQQLPQNCFLPPSSSPATCVLASLRIGHLFPGCTGTKVLTVPRKHRFTQQSGHHEVTWFVQLQHSSRGPVQPVQRVAPSQSEAQSPRVGGTIRTL